MGIKYLNETQSNEGDGLPWVKDWHRVTTDNTRILELIHCYEGDKGLLCLTTEYKSFLFRNSTDYGILIEALNHFVESKKYVFPIVFKAVTKNKLLFGIDDEKPKVIWHREDTKIYSVRKEESLNKPKENPLIAMQGFPTQGQEDPENDDLPTSKNPEGKPPRKAKNTEQPPTE